MDHTRDGLQVVIQGKEREEKELSYITHVGTSLADEIIPDDFIPLKKNGNDDSHKKLCSNGENNVEEREKENDLVHSYFKPELHQMQQNPIVTS